MGAIDRAARRWAEQQITRRAQHHEPTAAAVAHIGSPRFLRELVWRGTVSDVVVQLFGVAAGALRLRRLEIVLDEVRVIRRALWRGRVELVDLGSGRVSVEIEGASLAAAVGVPLVFHEDEVEIRHALGPVAVSARGALSVRDDVLRFRPGSIQGFPLLVSFDFVLPLPLSPLWPRAAAVRSVEGGLVVSCDLADVPPGLAASVSDRGG